MSQAQRLSATKRLVEQRHRRPVEALLRGYHDLGWDQGRIAAELGVSRHSVMRWYREYGIQTRRGRKVA